VFCSQQFVRAYQLTLLQNIVRQFLHADLIAVTMLGQQCKFQAAVKWFCPISGWLFISGALKGVEKYLIIYLCFIMFFFHFFSTQILMICNTLKCLTLMFLDHYEI